MKFNIKLPILLLFVTILSFSCKKDKTEDTPADLPIGTMTALINGNELKSSVSTAAITDVFTYKSLSITSTNVISLTDIKTLLLFFAMPLDEEIIVKDYIEEGFQTCDLTPGFTNICSAIVYSEQFISTGVVKDFFSDSDVGNSSINITSIDFKSGGAVTGTFSGKLDFNGEIVNVTKGKFNVMII